MMCAKVENSPIIFMGGQRARVTEQRVRRGRIQFVKQAPLFENSVKYSASIEYADQTDEIVRHALRVCQSGTPGPCYIEYPSHVILEDLDVPEPLAPESYRLVKPGADGDMVAKAAELVKQSENPILLVGHGVQTSRGGDQVKALAEVMGCPVIQTSGGTAFIPGLEDRTFPYGFSKMANEAVSKSICVLLSAPSWVSLCIMAAGAIGKTTKIPVSGCMLSSMVRRLAKTVLLMCLWLGICERLCLS